MRIDLHTQAFNTLIPEVDGSQWLVTGIEGWDSPGLRQSSQPATSRHGQVLTESLLDTRSVTLKGIVKAVTAASMWTSYAFLSGLTNNLVVPRTLKVYEDDATKQAFYIRGGSPRMELIGGSSFEFEIPLVFMDPLKYAVTPKVGTLGATLTNTGNFTTQPTLTVTSGGTLAVTNTTESASATFTSGGNVLPTGTVVDFLNRSVKSAIGASLYTLLDISSVFWSLQPGANVITKSGTASVSYTFQDAWI